MRPDDPSSMLLIGARSADARMVKEYLDAGGDPNQRDSDGMTALHYAAAFGARPCIRLLVKSGRCNYLLKDKYGRYASELAYEWGLDYAVGELLSKKEAMQAYKENVEL